ncbi:TetR/AcrR family transcriptional regulator [Frigidibacter oleivorans]|uniref:TetR/AcrR family transcriptional regulator n=1 Tax=Frigidibacter oleivorans TaxID=2487129 RepID=UPI000F8CA093|nr:TetR/AcrR family transcriptional regulator [Frigidibacter oleivorans]
MQERKPNAERRAETRAALIGAARALFLEKGFADTGTPEIVRHAGVTRGALYHHFEDKTAVFAAVIAAEANAVQADVEAAAPGRDREALLDGATAWFEAMRQPGRARLLLLEGPAVLGISEMRRIDRERGGAGLREAMISARPDTDEAEIEALADLVSALFDRAALAIEDGAEPGAYHASIRRIIITLGQ